jgi:hypothetical protein
MRPRTILRIYVTKFGYVGMGKYTRFRIRSRQTPLRTDSCALPPTRPSPVRSACATRDRETVNSSARSEYSSTSGRARDACGVPPLLRARCAADDARAAGFDRIGAGP